MMYIVAFVDRVNVGFAKQHLQAATGMSEVAFALGASLFFISYFLCEAPSNLALARFGARMWMCRIMVVWGLVSAATMFVQGNTSFYIIRLLLGAAEAGFFPGVILYLTYWFPAHRRMTMLGLFYFRRGPFLRARRAPYPACCFSLRVCSVSPAGSGCF